MNRTDNAWTIVISGDWNIRILTPEWIGINIFNTKSLDINAGFRAGVFIANYRFKNLIITPLEDKVIFASANNSEDELEEAEKYCISLLNKLPQTPIRAFGINFSFETDKPSDCFLKIFEISDAEKISMMNSTVIETEVRRTLQFEGLSFKLNLKHTLNQSSLAISHLNNHYTVKSATEAAELLQGSVKKSWSQAVKVFNDFYDINLDITGEEDEEA